MPTIEYGYEYPDYPDRYRSVCLVRTLQSMIAATLNTRYVVPENLYRVRSRQVEPYSKKGLDIWTILENLRLLKPGLIHNTDSQDLNTLIAGLRLEEQAQVVGLLQTKRLMFFKVDASQAVGLAEQSIPVGVSIIIPNSKRLTLHAFHLGFGRFSRLPVDLSDHGTLRKEMNAYIKSGHISSMLDESRHRYDTWNAFALV